MYRGHKISVIIPVYKEENFIRNTISSLPDFIDKIHVIDDGSPDKVSHVVKSLPDTRVELIQHEVNKGLGAAICTGYKAALKEQIDIVVKIDGDGQMNPDYMKDLLIPIVDKKADYTKGDRLSNPEHRRVMPKFRLIGNFILTWQTRIASGYWHVSDPQNGYTAISRKALENIDINNIYSYYGAANDILVKLNASNLKVADVPMPAVYGKEKSSIKYKEYIPKVSSLLLRRFLWRLRVKYITPNFLTNKKESGKVSIV